MSSEVADVVGAVIATIARELLKRSGDGPRPALRVSGFSHDEVVAALGWLQNLARDQGDDGIVIKVGARSPDVGLPADVLLKEGETLTYWRNQEVPAILLFDWDIQGDEEGLAAINRLDDAGLLNAEDAEEAASRFDLVTLKAWQLSGARDQPPARLGTVLASVRDAVGATGDISLRRWTAYVLTTCAAINQAPLRTPQEVDRAAGLSLRELELFSDEDLFESEAAARSRLARNVNVSNGRQPSGTAISDDDLLERIEKSDLPVTLLDRFGLSDPQARDSLRAVVLGGGARARAVVDLSLWLELFERKADRMGLGQLVRAEIADRDPARLTEFDELDVEAGLDHSEQIAAERLLRAEPVEGMRPLVDILPARLRRRVEKVAFPDAQIEADPLRALLHAMSVLDDEADGSVQLKLEGLPEAGRWSRWLFAFLYGPTLAHVRDEVEDARLTLSIDEFLLDASRPAADDSDDDFDVAHAWAPLRLAVAIPDVGVRRFRWDPLATPGLVAFAALLNGYEVLPGEQVGCDLDAFFDRLNLPSDWARPATDPGSLGPNAARLDALRRAHFSRWGSGIEADALEQYLAEWEPVLNEARRTLVPANAPDPDLADVVLADVLQLAQGRLVMLATHPLRLRWLARHFRRMSQLLVRCMSAGLDLNGENTELFFEWLQRVSPHGTPPLVVGPDETVAIAVRETAWHEEYVPIRDHGREGRDWLSAVDDAAIEELVKVIASYVETYPHKRDGLSLLMLDMEGTARLPLRLARRVRARIPNIRFELLVLADRAAHHEIVRAFDSEFADDEIRDGRLLPDVQLVLREWLPESELDLTEYEDRVDLALAPALFGTRTTLNQKTRDASAGLSGSYDPWIHRSTHDLDESSQNVVRAMLPGQRDPLLETWSTLCVRHDAHSSVAPQQDSNTDYFEMQVRFDKHQKLFIELHKVAHWVVTLDAFIGRDQIDALDDKPDVILVRPGVGKNEAYTLIVSSGTGRRFVVQRLRRKLRDIGVVDDSFAEATAERFYEVGRSVVPGAVLRALGLGSAANEIVGLVVSRFAVAQVKAVRSDRPGLEVWLSFDEQQNWFGRVQRTRADLGRFVLTLDDQDEVRLEVLVVESKFRQTFGLGAAEQQLDRTTELCLAAFRSGQREPDDRQFWLQELASAIEQTSALRLPAADLPARRRFDHGRESLEATILGALRSGQVHLDSVQGVAVAIAAASDETAPKLSALGGHQLIRINRPELRRIVRELVACTDPSAAGAAEASAPGSASHPASPAAADFDRTSERDTAQPRDGVEEASLARRSPETSTPRGLGERELRLRYERLLDVLSQHNVSVVPAAADPWMEGPGFYVLRVAPNRGHCRSCR